MTTHRATGLEHVVAVVVHPPYTIDVTFDDGAARRIDLTDELWGPVFEPLQDVGRFSQFEVSPILHTIRWDNDADLAPEFLQQKLWEQKNEWENANLKREKLLMMLQQQKMDTEAIALQQKEELLKKEKEKEQMILEIEREKLDVIMESKNNELKSMTIQISHKNELLNKIKESINKSVNENTNPDIIKILTNVQLLLEKGLNSGKEWEMFKMHFNNVHEDFLKKLQHDFTDLKPSSLKLCAYLKMRLTSKQISVLTNTTPDSIIKARYRLRKKFKLDKDSGLDEFLNNY